MRLSWLLSLPAMLSVVSAMAIQKRDADFYSVRTKMHKDMSGRRGDPKGKYFHESVFHPHYDGRFADKQLGYRERRQALSNLVQTYLATFADIGVETWLMHGTLLGWWWNRKIMPWDSDSDVQVSEASMHYLASYYNMSVFHYKTPRIPEGRDYMLEVNPHYVNREQSDKLNVIDARWIDTSSGLFIDITTARYNHTHPAGEGMLSCKDGHEYRDSYIFPLRDTFFEGAPAKIPFAYKEILEAEYNEKALTQVDFEGHHFDDQKLEWIPVPKKLEEPKKVVAPPPPKQQPVSTQQQPGQNQAPAGQQTGQQQANPQSQQQGQRQTNPQTPPPSQQVPPPAQQGQQGQQKQQAGQQPGQQQNQQGQQQNQQAQQQNQQGQQQNTQQSQPQTQQQNTHNNQQPANDPPPAQSAPQSPAIQAQTQHQSSPPPVGKQVRKQVEKPPIQKAVEEKIFTKQQKQEFAVKQAEEKRKAAEQKALVKEEKRLKSQEQADKKAARKAQEKTNPEASLKNPKVVGA